MELLCSALCDGANYEHWRLNSEEGASAVLLASAWPGGRVICFGQFDFVFAPVFEDADRLV